MLPTNTPPMDADLRLERLEYDLENPGDATARERDRILSEKLPGCWYVNPMCRVSSRRPTTEFFGEVRRRQGAWCRMLTLRLHGDGWRSKKALAASPIERALEFEGLLILDGELAFLKDIPELEACLGHRPSVFYRPEAYRLLRERSWDALNQITESELHRCAKTEPLEPDNALFILPNVTVRSPIGNEAFFEEAVKRNGEWHRKIGRLFPKAKRKAMARQVGDLRQVMPRGVLAVNGERLPISPRKPLGQA